MSTYKGSACGMGGYNPVKGERDVRDLGGFSDEDMAMVDELPHDRARRRLLVTWFGSHGGYWAWDAWRAARGRL